MAVYGEIMKEPLYVENPKINYVFSMLEVEKVVKTNKATWIDGIPNEMLKSKYVTNLLYTLLTSALTWEGSLINGCRL